MCNGKDFKPSELHPSGEYYSWNLTDDEIARVDDMVGCDLKAMGITFTDVVEDRSACPGCGKLSGLDDFVENALRWGIHSREFIRDVLLDVISKEGSPAHNLECSKCQTGFGMQFVWAGRWE